MPFAGLLSSLGVSGATAAPAAQPSLPVALIAATVAAILLVASAKKLYTWARVQYYLAKVREERVGRGVGEKR